jgi:hypothetical protein
MYDRPVQYLQEHDCFIQVCRNCTVEAIVPEDARTSQHPEKTFKDRYAGIFINCLETLK